MAAEPVHVVAVANFFGPRTGGLKTALLAIGRGYRAAGHRYTLVVPGERDGVVETDAGPMHTVAAPLVPGWGGYRVILRTPAVRRLLDELAPDQLELHDRTTLHGLTRWARSRGRPCVLMAHERLDGVLASAGLPDPLARALADVRNRASIASGAVLVATTAFAAQELERLGAHPHRVPLGVDTEVFAPLPQPGHEGVELLLCSRLSREKRPELAIGTLRELRRRGVDARLTVAGHGPMAVALQRLAAELPVRFLGFVPERDRLRGVLAAADISLAPGPIETFGLAALESMACGTPVVGNAASALPEVIGEDPRTGRAATGTPEAFADAVEALAQVPVDERRAAARGRALDFPWSRTVAALLALPTTPRDRVVAHT